MNVTVVVVGVTVQEQAALTAEAGNNPANAGGLQPSPDPRGGDQDRFRIPLTIIVLTDSAIFRLVIIQLYQALCLLSYLVTIGPGTIFAIKVMLLNVLFVVQRDQQASSAICIHV